MVFEGLRKGLDFMGDGLNSRGVYVTGINASVNENGGGYRVFDHLAKYFKEKNFQKSPNQFFEVENGIVVHQTAMLSLPAFSQIGFLQKRLQDPKTAGWQYERNLDCVPRGERNIPSSNDDPEQTWLGAQDRIIMPGQTAFRNYNTETGEVEIAVFRPWEDFLSSKDASVHLYAYNIHDFNPGGKFHHETKETIV